MGLFSKNKENPLHLAVIHNDISTVKNLAPNKQLYFETNGYGYTPLELAHYLQRKEVLDLLDTAHKDRKIKVLLPDEKELQVLSEEAFLKEFNIKHLKTLHFNSYEEFKNSLRKFPSCKKGEHCQEIPQELGRQYHHHFIRGDTANMSIRWIDNSLGYGVFAEEILEENSYVGEYTGLVRRLFRFNSDPNAYCYHYPTHFFSFKSYVIDAMHEGNIMRFVNHSDIPNLQPVCMSDRGLKHIGFMTKRRILSAEQLTIDYGEDYWQLRRKKQL